MLVRFLSSREQQAKRCRDSSEAPSLPELYGDPEALASNPQLPQVLKAFRIGVVFRPSRAAGKMYPEVSSAYSGAVHAVLTRKKSAAQAAADLQDELQQMLKR